MQQIGILGGTFDPPHLGHISMALAAIEKLYLDLIYFLPAGIPPLKAKPPSASPQDRFKMTQLAIQGNPKFDILDWEIQKRTTSYSIETARTLKKNWPSFRFFWIIGADVLATLDRWMCIDELVQLVDFAVVMRPGSQLSIPHIPKLNLHYIDKKKTDISSTDIRERITNNLPFEQLLPESVYNYIKINNIYK